MRFPIRTATLAVALAAVACSKEAGKAPAVDAGAARTEAPAPASPAAAEPAGVPQTAFSNAELDQMVAPIALYSDPLLAQVLMAATYPGDVADAAKWTEAHPDAQGDDAVRQVADQPWDPSVQSLVAFPQALALLGQDPAWVQRLGDAFLAQPDDVMDAVQRLRHQAMDAGNLASNEYQNISTEAVSAPEAAPMEEAPVAQGAAVQPAPAASSDVIVIQPTNPDVVYVPTYNPTQVYGTWGYPSYPPTYYPPPARYYAPGSALVNGMMWGVGVAITDSLWGGFDWGHDDIDIDINRYNNFDFDRDLNLSNNKWEHNSLHRDGVPYRDQASRERYGRQLGDSASRDAFRGDTANRSAERDRARQSLQSRGVEAPARSNQEARTRAREATQGGGLQGGNRPNDRDAARERAQSVAQGRDNPQARERAQGAAQNARNNPQQARERAQSAAQSHPDARAKAQTARANPEQARQKAAQRANKPTSNTQARKTAQQQHARQAAPQNNAFRGASHPTASRSQAQRGHASQSHASRPQQARQAPSHQVQRQAHAPNRQSHASNRQPRRR